MNHKFYLGTVITKGKELPYYWLHIVNNSFDGIDFEKSKFMEADLFQEKVKTVKVITALIQNKITGYKLKEANFK